MTATVGFQANRTYTVRECQRGACGLRLPVLSGDRQAATAVLAAEDQ